MSKARKSSIEGTRRPLKAHIPYRADDFTRGKKTGVNVREVARRSDGFEGFDDLLKQADAFTPPHLQGRRRAHHSLTPPDEEEDEDDENGEMDMDIDDTMTTNYGGESPGVYFNNAPRPSAPSSANRSAATGVGSNRSSYIDFDRIPSPRPSSSSHRVRSQLNGSGAITPTPRPKSNLSHQTVVPSSPEDDDSDNEPFHDAPAGDDMEYDFGAGNDDFNNDFNIGPASPGTSSPVAARTSFSEIAQDDTDPPQIDDIQISSPPRKVQKKGKQKESIAQDDMALEEEIAQGLDEVEQEADEQEPQVNGKKSKAQQKKRSRNEAQKENQQVVKRKRIQEEGEPGHETRDGVRRGTRTRIKPLDWWRLEKVVYGRRDSGQSMIPVIKEIIRIPKEVPAPMTHKRYRSKPRSQSKTGQGSEDQEVIVFNPEEGWDERTDPHGVVLDFRSGHEVQRRLAFTAKMVVPKPAANNDFLYQKVFGDGEFIAAGQLVLPVGGRKPSKITKDNTYIFYLIEGAVNLKVHRTSFVLATGGMFLIPRGNTYYLENISQRPAKLFFAQARRVNSDEEPLQEVVDAPPPGSDARTRSVDPAGPRYPSAAGGKSGSLQRSSSLAAPGSGDRLNPPDKRAAAKRAVSK